MANKIVTRINTLARQAAIPAATVAALVATSAHAAIDVTAATTGITDASTAVLAVIGALITMAVAIWGVRKVLKMFGR